MANGFSGPVAQIVDNYLERLKKGLKGISAKDQDELVREINSHIYESFRNDPTPDEVARILKVLDKLGEPSAVISGPHARGHGDARQEEEAAVPDPGRRPHRLLRRPPRPRRPERGRRPDHRRPGPRRVLLHRRLQPDPRPAG
ncbi:MAG: hypothetical protein MZU84_06145 [Sphingobacterium sp.]|nr:hypothetical protein [Sphingobacterium sp.]